MAKYTLYGDGFHDDTDAIQEMIDSGACEVVLPTPTDHYLISRPLQLPSNFRLVLPRYARIRLADGANCLMVQNKLTRDRAERVSEKLFDFINEFSDKEMCRNIEVVGGVWDFNNRGQNPNPLQTHVYEPTGYTGIGMVFYRVRGLRLSALTLKDPVNFAVTLDTVSYFTVEDIVFDFNHGNPNATNMDGIHCDGNCHFGHLRNLQGACYDDLIALNADEGTGGPITHIDVDGIYCEDCHSAARLLTVKYPVEHIHITNVHGTFYQYCIGITKFYKGESAGYYDSITLDNIYASKAERIPIYGKAPNSYVYPIIYIENSLHVKNLHIHDLHRREYINPVETLHVGWETRVDHLVLRNITLENHTNADRVPMWVNHGKVNVIAQDVYEDGEPVAIVSNMECL